MSVVDVGEVTTGVLTMLIDAMPCPVGDGAAPLADDDEFVEFANGYAILYRVPSGARYMGSGIAATSAALQWVRFQVTTAGLQRDQVELFAARALGAFLDRASGAYVNDIDVPGHSVIQRVPAGDVPLEQLGSAQSGVLVDLLVSRNGPVS